MQSDAGMVDALRVVIWWLLCAMYDYEQLFDWFY